MSGMHKGRLALGALVVIAGLFATRPAGAGAERLLSDFAVAARQK